LLIGRSAASICVGLLVAELLIFLLVDPNKGQCPGWTIYATNGSSTYLWILAAMFTAAPTVWICYIVLRWEHFAQKINAPNRPQKGFDGDHNGQGLQMTFAHFAKTHLKPTLLWTIDAQASAPKP